MKISTAQKSNAELLILDLIKDIHKLKFHEIPTWSEIHQKFENAVR